LFDYDAKDKDVNRELQKLFFPQIHKGRYFAKPVSRIKGEEAFATASYKVLYEKRKKLQYVVLKVPPITDHQVNYC